VEAYDCCEHPARHSQPSILLVEPKAVTLQSVKTNRATNLRRLSLYRHHILSHATETRLTSDLKPKVLRLPIRPLPSEALSSAESHRSARASVSRKPSTLRSPTHTHARYDRPAIAFRHARTNTLCLDGSQVMSLGSCAFHDATTRFGESSEVRNSSSFFRELSPID